MTERSGRVHFMIQDAVFYRAHEPYAHDTHGRLRHPGLVYELDAGAQPCRPCRQVQRIAGKRGHYLGFTVHTLADVSYWPSHGARLIAYAVGGHHARTPSTDGALVLSTRPRLPLSFSGTTVIEVVARMVSICARGLSLFRDVAAPGATRRTAGFDKLLEILEVHPDRAIV